MAKGVIITEEVLAQLKQMYSWFTDHKGRLQPAQTRKGRGGGGSSSSSGNRRVFVKATPGATYDVDCFLDEDLEDWEALTNYSKGDRVTESEIEYISVQDGNVGNPVADTGWWTVDDTSITVTVKTYSGGGFLNACEPLLVDGEDFYVWYDVRTSTWRNVTTFFEVDDCET